MKKYDFCTAHRHTTHVPMSVFLETRTLGCYAGNHIIKVKNENKVARGIPIK
jgi:hypothetical protein